MAVPVNKIGIYDFMSLLGQLEPPTYQREIDQRPGVDGTEILSIGKRGVPFTLISLRDCPSYSDAQDAYNLYKAIELDPTSGPVEVVQSDYSTVANGSYVCSALAVRLISIRNSPVIVGGIANTSGALLEVEWTLIGISL